MVIYAMYGSLDLSGLIDELILNDGISPLYSTHRMRLKVNKKAHKREYRKRIYPLIELYSAGMQSRYQSFYLFAPEQMEKPIVYASAKLTITPHTTYSLSVTKVAESLFSWNIQEFGERIFPAMGVPAHLLGRYQQPRELFVPRRVELDEISPETPVEQYPEWLQSVVHRYTVGVDVGVEEHDYTVFQERTLIEGDGGEDGDRT